MPIIGRDNPFLSYHSFAKSIPFSSSDTIFKSKGAYFDEKSNRFSEKSFGRNSYVALAWWIYKNSIMRGTELLHIALDIFVGMCYNINILAENGL